MERILFIEDSAEFGLYIKSALKEYEIFLAPSLSDAFHLLKTGRKSFDLVLLDVSLPDGNGIKSLDSLKEYFSDNTTPFIVLTSDDDILSKVAAFGLGADDYLTKPPHIAELKARIAARLRISQLIQKKMEESIIGDLTINSEKMLVEQELTDGHKRSLDLTPLEFKILKFITSRIGQIYTRDQLIDHVWGVGKFLSERSVDAHVSHLRKKISESRVEVSTVIGIGYKAIIKDIAPSLE